MCKESKNIQYPGNISQKIYSKNIGKLWSRYYNISKKKKKKIPKNIGYSTKNFIKYETPIIRTSGGKKLRTKYSMYEKDLSNLLEKYMEKYEISNIRGKKFQNNI